MIPEFDFGVYPWRLWVSCDAHIPEQKEYFGTEIPDWQEHSDGEAFTVSKKLPDGRYRHGVYIRFRRKADMTDDIIAHESGHAALEVFGYFGCKVDFANQEPFCYLLGFTAGCCETVKRFKNK